MQGSHSFRLKRRRPGPTWHRDNQNKQTTGRRKIHVNFENCFFSLKCCFFPFPYFFDLFLVSKAALREIRKRKYYMFLLNIFFLKWIFLKVIFWLRTTAKIQCGIALRIGGTESGAKSTGYGIGGKKHDACS